MNAKAAALPEEPVNAPLRPVGETLSAVALEVSELAQLSDSLKALISVALVNDAADSDHMREFQAIDLLVQQLHGVSQFMRALADRTPTNWRVDAAGATNGVVLSALAQRLAGSSIPVPSSVDEDAGSLDFFG